MASINYISGAYIYQDNYKIIIFIYVILDTDDMNNEFPVSCEHKTLIMHKYYLTILYDMDSIHISQKNLEEVKETITKHSMLSLFSTEYNILHKRFNRLTYEIHDALIVFARREINKRVQYSINNPFDCCIPSIC